MNTSDDNSTADAGSPAAGSLAGQAQTVMARWPWLAAVAAVLLLIGAAVVLYTLFGGGSRPLYPALPTFTPLAEVITSEPAQIGFTELNADPAAFRDRRIQVAGNYASLAAPDCVPFAGPLTQWSLVSEELQLNATGFENVLRLIDEGTPMTVTGVWRLYRGPVGCGKEPAEGTVWYLDVDQITEPNPLFGSGEVALTVEAGSALPTLPPLDLSSPTPEATPTLTPTLELEATLQPTVTLGQPTQALPTATLATTGTSTITATATTTGTLGPSVTPDLTATAATATASPSPSPTATGGSGGTVTPGIPTATPSGTTYPDPTTYP